MGNGAFGMHGRSVQIMPMMQLLLKVLVTVFLKYTRHIKSTWIKSSITAGF